MVARVERRLAGFRFESQPPPLDDVLPRMDVAVFVGFAASGPLHLPVPVESAVQFAAIFGNDAELAWDRARGETARAHLAPAVRAFFRNGGRRCWIIRVAGAAVSNYFPVPGLAWLGPDGKTIAPAVLQARSEGSWSDDWKVSATVEADVVPVEAVVDRIVTLKPVTGVQLSPGDLLRIHYAASGSMQVCAVQSVDGRQARLGPAVWLQATSRLTPALPGTLTAYTHLGPRSPLPIRGLTWASDSNAAVQLDIDCQLADAPALGTLVRATFGQRPCWLIVNDVWETPDAGSPPGKRTRLTGTGYWQLAGLSSPPEAVTSVERLTFDLWARHEDEYPARLSELGFAPGHPTYWATLPTDVEAFSPTPQGEPSSPGGPSFPFAGVGTQGLFAFPLGMALFPQTFLGPEPATASALERDGVATFDANLFLGGDDPVALRDLLEAGTNRLLEVADFLRYQAPRPRTLQGIYAALAIEEATLLVVPDAVHPGWERPTADRPASPVDAPAAPVPADVFAACNQKPLTAPTLQVGTVEGGSFTLSWSPVAAVFELQEAVQPNFSDAATLFVGSGDHVDMRGHRAGDYYYRLRYRVGAAQSGWSAGTVVRVSPPRDWQTIDAGAYDDATLLIVQRAMLRLCAGRGDMLAVLALPAHYREDLAIAHVSRLTPDSGPLGKVHLQVSPPAQSVCRPLSLGESATPSFGALYHPWLIGREEGLPDELRLVPPDGAACGLIAQRALTRGAWVAPANQVLAGPVSLSPTLAVERQLDLLVAQVNLIRAEPRGFLSLSADTLSADEAVRPINVRRLLILLRRLALRLGADYVFEPNSDAFRRGVQRSFESTMDFLYQRGAFAGRTPGESFQVVTGSAVNTPRDTDQGRFFVELRVAPSLPLTFLTIRLVQSGQRGTVTEVL